MTEHSMATPYRCGCVVHEHGGQGSRIHRHPCQQHPSLHDHIPAPLAYPDDPQHWRYPQHGHRPTAIADHDSA